MSVKSTHLITRDTALHIIMKKVFSLDDSQLANTLESVVDSDYHNFWIVDKEEIEKNKSKYIEFDGVKFFSGSPYIEDSNYFD